MIISIIVPIYNSSRYLSTCINSLREQSWRDFEVICVDDGSTDNSADIVASVAAQDSRFRLIRQSNGGVSSARNAGLEYASGVYVAFIDSDDTIAADYLGRLWDTAKSNADLILSGMVDLYDGGEVKRVELGQQAFDLQREADLIDLLKTPLMSSPVSKLYRRQVIADNNLRFDTSLSFAEDKDFNLRFVSHCRNVSSTDYCGYFYRREVVGSLSKKTYDYRYRTEYGYWHMMKSLFDVRNFASEQSRRFLVNRLFNVIVDEVADYASLGLSQAEFHRRFELSKSLIDNGYISLNRSLIDAQGWQKALVLCRWWLAMFMILKYMKR